MGDASVGCSCDIALDVRGVRRQRVSLSSVDSEPIPGRCRPDAATLNDSGDDSKDNNNNYYDNDDGSASDASEGQTTLASVVPREGSPSAEAQLSCLYAPDGEPLRHVPADRVSAPVAVVAAIIPRGCTVVADAAVMGPVVDTGTRLCLADGAVVGVVATVMGPVASCAYAVACLPAVFCDLCGGGALAVGSELCSDAGEQTVIYDPVAQCDVRRGTDASYINDEELPPHARPDFSDDEAERQWKMNRCMAADVEQISSEDEPVDVDWEKIDAIEACMQNNYDARQAPAYVEEKTRTRTTNTNTATTRQMTRLVIPPWVTTATTSNGTHR